MRGGEACDYQHIYQKSCYEENTSTRLHPLLRLRPPSDAENKRAVQPELNSTPSESKNAEDNETQRDQGCFDHVAEGGHTVGGQNPISCLPLDILGRILQHILVFDGQLVHAISRLDPYQEAEPSAATTASTSASDINAIQLLRRFHIGTRRFNLTHAPHPSQVLAPLLVCKKWNYIGCNLFYSLNRFCFSSLGE